MRVNFSYAFLAVALFTSCFSSPAQASKLGQGQIWKLDQKSCTVGSISVYVSDNAFRWSCNKLGLTIVTQAPKWEVMAYNESNKKYMQLSDAQMKRLVGHADPTKKRLADKGVPDLMKAQSMYERLPVNPKICGARAIEYHIPRVAAKFHRMDSGHVDPFVQRELNESYKKTVVKTYDEKKWKPGDEDFFVAEDIPIPTGAADRMGYDIQHPHAWLRTVQIGDKGISSMAFDTIACTKIPFSKAIFTVPNGFTKTTNEVALMMGMDEEEEVDLLADPGTRRKPEAGLGLAREMGKKLEERGMDGAHGNVNLLHAKPRSR